MIIAKTIAEVRQQRWADPGASWGLVPTMGFLHEGHLSLVQLARAQNDKTAVSIFVNPTQFAPTEDLDSYPRDLQRDLALLAAAGTDLVFVPDNAAIYPPDFQTEIRVVKVSQPLEGQSRPTHFAGVATVVAKLFNIVQPTRAYFGQKDAQQTVVIRQMVRDLNFNLALVIGPTVREADGLALSSRNKYLTPAQRQAATVLHRALTQAQAAHAAGERSGSALRRLMAATIAAEPLARLDYVSAADPNTLAELEQIEQGVLLSTAVYFDNPLGTQPPAVRLIDNILIQP